MHYTFHSNGDDMNHYSKPLLMVALAAITVLTLFQACEDSFSVKDTPPQDG